MKNSVTANINLTLYGKPVALNLSFPDKLVKPRRMLPVLQKITNKFVETAVDAFVGENEKISCQAGCGACCYQPIPLAEFESYQLAEVVEELPESRRAAVKQRFAEALEKLKQIDWFNRLEAVLNQPDSKEEVRKLALEYFAEKIPCPFLEQESCTIYLHRPLACREYLVTSPAENCQAPTPENIKQVDLKFKVSEVVRSLWKTENLPNTNFVTMIYALEWTKKHSDKFGKKRGEEWLGEFFNRLSKGENSTK